MMLIVGVSRRISASGTIAPSAADGGAVITVQQAIVIASAVGLDVRSD